MHIARRAVAAVELVLIGPAALFMTALFVRNWQPQQYEPAHTAQRIVLWFAGRPHVGLWLLLIALPLVVLIVGSATLLAAWNEDSDLRAAAGQMLVTLRTHLAMAIIAAATLASGGILGIIALHVLTD